MKDNLETMPIFGEMRKRDKRLTFRQYLTVLAEWHSNIKKGVQEKLTIAERDSRYEVNWKHVKDLKEILANESLEGFFNNDKTT